MPAPHRLLVQLARGGALAPDRRITTALVDSAIEHGVAPLLDETARRVNAKGEHDALVQLAMFGLDSAAASAAASDALDELIETAEAVGVEIAIFKGMAIGVRWYPRPDLRPAADIDVFINPADDDRFGEFVEYLTGRPESRVAINAMVAEGRVFEYPIIVNGVPVDVHIDPMNLVVLSRQRSLMWQRTESITTPNGSSARALDLELSLVQALLHLFRDNFADLLHIHDIQLMIDRGPDWEFVESYARTEGLTDVIRFSLARACDVLDRPSPLSREISRPSRAVIRLLWPDRILLRGNDSIARSHRRQSLAGLLIAGRRLEVARALIGRLFPPRVVIDDRFEGCECPYPIALLRWRLSQRAGIKRYNKTTTEHANATV